MNFLDKMITSIDPIKGEKRLKARLRIQAGEKLSYANYGASKVKKTMVGWVTKLLSPDKDTGGNRGTLVPRARDLTMGGSSIALGALRKIRTNVAGSGLIMKATVDQEYLGLKDGEKRALEKHIERVWDLWANSKDCDMSRQCNFYQMTGLALYSFLQNGDCFALLPYRERAGDLFGLKVQLIESDRCRNPQSIPESDTVRFGVEVNSYGETVAYYFSNSHPSETDTGYVKVEAYGSETGKPNVLVLMDRERIGQRRGVPYLSPVIEDIKQLGRYTEAEAMAAVVNALFTVFIENEKEDTQTGLGRENYSEEEEVDEDDDVNYELGTGTVIELAPGQKANTQAPGRPNSQFDPFVTAMCKQIGSALELPFEVLMNNFNSSYSASRAALLEVWKMYKMKRVNLITDFCQPVYEQFFDESVARGYIVAPGYFENPLTRAAYLKAEWHGPAQGQLDPLKEAKAAQLRVQEDFSTRAREARELTGSSWESNIQQRQIEEKERSTLNAYKIESKTEPQTTEETDTEE